MIVLYTDTKLCDIQSHETYQSFSISNKHQSVCGIWRGISETMMDVMYFTPNSRRHSLLGCLRQFLANSFYRMSKQFAIDLATERHGLDSAILEVKSNVDHIRVGRMER